MNTRFTDATGPLRHRNFRLAWSGDATSVMGDRFHDVALAWLVLTLTGSPGVLGGVFVAKALAQSSLLLVGGAVVDRLSARTLLVISSLARGGLVLVIAALIANGTVQIWHIVLLEICFGLANAFSVPAAGSIMPTVVPAGQLEAANALTSISENISRLVGPLAAGAVVVGGGIAWSFAIDAASFAVAAGLVAMVRTPTRARLDPGSDRITAEISEGLRHLWDVRATRVVALVSGASCLAFAGPFLVGLPALAQATSGGSALTLGLLLAAWGFGQLAGNIAVGLKGRSGRPERVIALLTVFAGVAWAGVGVSGALVATCGLIAAAGLLDGITEVLAPAWVQREVEPRLMGRVMGGLGLLQAVMVPVSLTISATLANRFSSLLFAGAGAVLIGAGATTALAFRNV